jgi:hypothetical protein
MNEEIEGMYSEAHLILLYCSSIGLEGLTKAMTFFIDDSVGVITSDYHLF